MAGVEIVCTFAVLWLKPIVSLVSIPLAVKFNFCSGMKTTCFRRESAPVFLRNEGRVGTLSGFVMKSDYPQLLFGQ